MQLKCREDPLDDSPKVFQGTAELWREITGEHAMGGRMEGSRMNRLPCHMPPVHRHEVTSRDGGRRGTRWFARKSKKGVNQQWWVA